MNGSKTFPLDVSPNDKVSDVVRPIPSNVCSNSRCEGRVPGRSDELKSGRVSDGSTVQVVHRMRGGGKHKDKKSKAEKKQLTGQEPVSNKGPAILESEKDKVIQSIEEDERYRNIGAYVSAGNDSEVEQRMQCWMTKLQKRPGADKGQMDMIECAIRWAFEARRKERSAEEEQKRTRQEEQE